MSELKYNIGDKVRIKSINWYNANKDEFGEIHCENCCFVNQMTQYCDSILTIEDKTEYYYWVNENAFVWTDEWIEGLMEEEMPLNIDDFQDDNEIGDVIDEYVYRLKDNECQINLPKGYIFKDENGNEILTSKIILEKKKEYPKTYEECCKIIHSDPKFYVDTHLYSGTLEALYKLFICRDAYWKIAGDEMELGKPWEPDWDDEKQDKYGYYNEVKYTIINSAMFVFPTPEMRDAFRENFDQDIEICK